MFEEFLRQRRAELGLRQVDLADALTQRGYRISRSRVAHWETGGIKPPLNEPGLMRALADVLQVDIQTIIDAAYQNGSDATN